MSKTQDEFLDHFARLGVFSKVQALMDPENENDTATTVLLGATAITAPSVEDQLQQSGSSGITSSAQLQQQTAATSGMVPAHNKNCFSQLIAIFFMNLPR